MTDLPQTSPPETTPATASLSDDDGAALERSTASIREAKEAAGSVAAHEDITSLDDRRAGEQSEDPDGQGGAP